MINVTDAAGNATAYGYDQHDHINSITDASGNTYKFTTDAHGRPLTIEDPLGHRWILTYDKKGNMTSATDEFGRTTTYAYDFKDRVTLISDASGSKTSYVYDPNGNLTEIREAFGTADQRTTIAAYDTSNRITSITDPMGNTTWYEYAGAASCPSCASGSAAIPTKIIDPFWNVTQFAFDKNGRVVGVKDPMNNFTNMAYDPNGNITKFTDANGNATSYVYAPAGRVAKQIDAAGGELFLTYDNRGNVKTLKDPEGNTTAFEYDSSDRLIKEFRPMGQVIEYTYYPDSQLKTVRDAKGQLTTYTYDAASRLTTITYADGKKDTFTYDAAGNMLTYSKTGVSGSFTYDALNRKTSETVNYGAFSKTHSYTYDALGNKATYTSPEGKTHSYTYNKNSQPASIAFDDKTISFDYEWTRLRKAVLPNGITTDYTYNDNSWLNYIQTKQGATTHLDKQYEFDKVGNISRITDYSSLITDYSYDPIYQLTSAESPTLTEEFTFDKVGNRLTSAASDQESAISYTHNANNETLIAGAVTYEYDQNGNTVQKNDNGQITTYTYNSADRLEKVALPDGRIATYIYDPFGRRIKKDIAGQVTYYAYADEGLIGEYDIYGNLKKSYGWSPDSIWGTNPIFMVENGIYYYYHNDHLGTTQKMTNEVGNVVWSATYMAFGEATVNPVSSITNNLHFPGQYYDSETGLHYNWNRYYEPETGRYIQVDPIGFGGSDVNLFRYAENIPNIRFDPYGLLTIPFTDIWIPAGEQAGQEAAMYWAEKSINPFNKLYENASLWTPCTSDKTFDTLTFAYGAAKYVGRPFWRYVGPESNPNSPWLTRGWGWKPPYDRDFIKATDKLQLPNIPTDVIRIEVPWNKLVRGPGMVHGNPGWGKGGGFEYYRGRKWPKNYKGL